MPDVFRLIEGLNPVKSYFCSYLESRQLETQERRLLATSLVVPTLFTGVTAPASPMLSKLGKPLGLVKRAPNAFDCPLAFPGPLRPLSLRPFETGGETPGSQLLGYCLFDVDIDRILLDNDL